MSDDSDVNQINHVVDLENGHFSDNDNSLSSTSDIEEESDRSNQEDTGQFDTNLPTTHKYLGKLDNVGGYTLYDDGQIIPHMLAIHTSTLVFPGFTLPLVIKEFESEHILDDIRKGNMFALICFNKNSSRLYEYGVMMEVFETSFKRGTLNLKAKGRQRCLVMPDERHYLSFSYTSRVQKLTVKILSEPHIPSPICNSQLRSLTARRTDFDRDHASMMRHQKYRKYHLSQYPYASWVYDHNELSYYMHLIAEGLSQSYDKESLPKDAVNLSYWFVQNYQLTYAERLEILRCNSVLERLRLEYRYLQMDRAITCGNCGTDIALQKDVFPMSKDGVQSNYCNPGGNVYETVTVMEAKNFTLVGESSKQFSWFPGYAWTIMQCSWCRGHLGWKFSSKNHNPQNFYGLANSSLDIKILTDNRGIVEGLEAQQI